MRRRLAKLLRKWADRIDPLDMRPNYQEMKILRRRSICKQDDTSYFFPYQNRIERMKDMQKKELLEELGQYMVIDRSVYHTHTLIETRISVLVE